MAQLRQDYKQFVERDTEVIAIGPEDLKTFTKWWDENQMPFIGIPDPDHSLAKLYGQEVKLLKLGRMPASFIIDKSGIIRFEHFGQSMSDIPENPQIFTLLDSL